VHVLNDFIIDGLGVRGKIATHLIASVPRGLRERAIFGTLTGQKMAQRAISGPLPVKVKYTRGLLAGLSFSCLTSEKYFIMGSDYEHHSISLVRPLLRPDFILYDIGAHAGFWSLTLARLCPQGKVFAFEPSPITLLRLRENVAQQANIRVIGAAVSDSAMRVTFREDGSRSAIANEGTSVVDCIRLDDQQLPAPNMIKIDIEGHAARALIGARNIIERHRPFVYAEIHNPEEYEAVSRLRDYRVAHVEAPGHPFPFHLLATPT
jgi:FkbM family methyltransferase